MTGERAEEIERARWRTGWHGAAVFPHQVEGKPRFGQDIIVSVWRVVALIALRSATLEAWSTARRLLASSYSSRSVKHVAGSGSAAEASAGAKR